MRRRTEPATEEIPDFVLSLDPDRYRWAAVEHLQGEPDDTWGAAMSVRREFAEERRVWLRQHGVQRWVNGRDSMGAPTAPVAWTMREFGTPAPKTVWSGSAAAVVAKTSREKTFHG